MYGLKPIPFTVEKAWDVARGSGLLSHPFHGFQEADPHSTSLRAGCRRASPAQDDRSGWGALHGTEVGIRVGMKDNCRSFVASLLWMTSVFA